MFVTELLYIQTDTDLTLPSSFFLPLRTTASPHKSQVISPVVYDLQYSFPLFQLSTDRRT